MIVSKCKKPEIYQSFSQEEKVYKINMNATTVNLVPDAHLLMGSLRSVGYKPETAIADIIDNSISAGAKQIIIKFHWNGDRSYIIISDNGRGMYKQDLINSMKIGSADPKTERPTDDLGRFGMGMKTASFSLGKKLTVITKKDGVYANACWDLDYIANLKTGAWPLIIKDESELKTWCEYLDECKCTTALLIEDLDRLVSMHEASQEKAKFNFYKTINTVSSHLGLIFHRFILDDGLQIVINGTPVNAWDPFVLSNSATQELAEESYANDNDRNKTVYIQPYVLPHKTKFTSEAEFNEAGGPHGWPLHQGIYLYRNRRLIIYGTWFNILRKEPAFNLARIKLDITSASDKDWKIDIKKSSASLPLYVHDLIEKTVELCTETSAKVYNSRGAYSKSSVSHNLSYVWEQRKNRAGRYSFHINKKHLLLTDLKKQINEKGVKDLNAYLLLVENFAPFLRSGVVDHLQPPNVGMPGPKEDRETGIAIEEIKSYIKLFLEKGFSIEETKSTVLEMANYRHLRAVICQIFEEGSYD